MCGSKSGRSKRKWVIVCGTFGEKFDYLATSRSSEYRSVKYQTILFSSNMESNRNQTPIYQRAVTPTVTIDVPENNASFTGSNSSNSSSSSGNGIVRGKVLHYQQPQNEQLQSPSARRHSEHPNLNRHNSETTLPSPMHSRDTSNNNVLLKSASVLSPKFPTRSSTETENEEDYHDERNEMTQQQKRSAKSNVPSSSNGNKNLPSSSSTTTSTSAVRAGSSSSRITSSSHNNSGTYRDSIRIIPCTTTMPIRTNQSGNRGGGSRTAGTSSSETIPSMMSLCVTGDNWAWQWGLDIESREKDKEMLDSVVEVALERVKLSVVLNRFVPYTKNLPNLRRLVLVNNGIESLHQLKDVVNSMVGASTKPVGSNYYSLDQLTILDNPVCQCSGDLLRSFLCLSLPWLKFFNDVEIVPLPKTASGMSNVGGSDNTLCVLKKAIAMSSAKNKADDGLQPVPSRAARKTWSSPTLSSPSEVNKKGTTTGHSALKIAVADHSLSSSSVSHDPESHNKFIAECGKAAISTMSEEGKFYQVFDGWMRKTILETIESARLVEHRDK